MGGINQIKIMRTILSGPKGKMPTSNYDECANYHWYVVRFSAVCTDVFEHVH